MRGWCFDPRWGEPLGSINNYKKNYIYLLKKINDNSNLQTIKYESFSAKLTIGFIYHFMSYHFVYNNSIGAYIIYKNTEV